MADSRSTSYAHTIKHKAEELRFDACGIAVADLADPEKHLKSWLERGFHADMTWMETTQSLRQDPRAILPEAQSVVVVAKSYYASRPAALPGTGRVSRYAWGRDYHNAMRKPLRALAQFISDLDRPNGPQPCHCSIDTAPILERAWAARAGVGWIGKNGMVIRPGLGSWFFLGTILTRLRIAPDAPALNRCGNCQRCLEACPTHAITAPCVVDSRACIAYHTIENRKSIPEHLQPSFGDWIFGCDACQEVCPWNRTVQETQEHDYHPRPGNAALDLSELQSMDLTEFNQRFNGSPIRRATLMGLRRNANIVEKNLNPPPIR